MSRVWLFHRSLPEAGTALGPPVPSLQARLVGFARPGWNQGWDWHSGALGMVFKAWNEAAVLCCGLCIWGLWWWWKTDMGRTNQGWEAQKVNPWCSRQPGRGSGRKGFADAAFLCSYLHLWQQPQPDSLSGSWPKALMTRHSAPGSQGPFVSEGYRLSLRRHIIAQLRAG